MSMSSSSDLEETKDSELNVVLEEAISLAGVELLKRDLGREIDMINNKVRETLQKKEEQLEIFQIGKNDLEKSLAEKKEEMERMEFAKENTVNSLKDKVVELAYKNDLLEENLKSLKHGFESRIVELVNANRELVNANKELCESYEELVNDGKCKDVSLALLQENILFSRQNTEAANKKVEVERREVETMRKQIEMFKYENEFQGLKLKSLTKQLEIDELTKEVDQLSSQIKRKHDGESEQTFNNKLKRSESGTGKLILVASKRNCSIASDEELDVCSDIASNYDPEEEVEEEFDFLESMKGEIESIFSHRSKNNNGVEYYVKWKNLSYAEATWEDEFFIKTQHTDELYKYHERRKSKTNPRSYFDAIKYSMKSFKPMKEQPDYIGGANLHLRKYQMDGINFLLSAWHKGSSAILADEKGLGKTIQAIGFLQYLFHNYAFKGPMLICVPVSTLAAWQMELCSWAPGLAVVCYAGDSKSRKIIRNHVCENALGELTFNVLLTDYELVCKDKTFFQDIVWSNIVLDEAHMLKEKGTMLYKVLMGVESHHRLLITGSPPQNNLEELWIMLNFLKLQDIDVGSWVEFEATYGSKTRTRYSGHVKLHALIKPFVIRRRRKSVEKSLQWSKIEIN